MKNFTCVCLFVFVSIGMQAQSVGIGTTTPNASALLDISSTTKGIRIPRMTTAQRDVILSPAAGLQILNTDDYCLDVYNGTSWIKNCGYKVTGTDTALSYRTIAALGVARSGAVAFTVGSKGYVGTGSDALNSYKKDIWEYDPATNIWTQKADFGGSARTGAVAFVIGTNAYLGTGFSGNMEADFWMFDPAINSWIFRTYTPNLIPRMEAIGFSLSGFGYFGLGYNPISNIWYQDVFKYDPNSNVWFAQADFPVKCHSMVAISSPIVSNAYVGIGLAKVISEYYETSFYKFTPNSGPNTWTAVAAFPGEGRYEATGFFISQNGYVGTGYNGSYLKDMWRYDITADSWTQMQNVGTTGRSEAVSFAIGTEAFIGTGYDGSYKSDFIGYVPYRLGPVYDNTLDLSLAGGISDGIWVQDLNKISTDNFGPSHMMITSTGNVGINTNISHAPLQLANGVLDRKIVLHEIADNNHQFFGFGIDQTGALRYQTGATTFDHVFYAGVNSTTSNELLRIKGNGSVGIGTSSPNASALLDVSSTTKGVLIPRMTTTQRNAIVTPQTGLLVFDITTNSFWFRSTSAWHELSDDLDTEVYRNGPDKIYMGLTDSVGIGTSNPAYKLEVKTATNDYGISQTDGTVHLATYIGDGGEIGTVSNHPFRLFANDGFYQFELSPTGNIGMGLGNPQNKLDIAAGTARTGVHPTGCPLYITGSLGDASNGVEIRDFDATQGVGIGRNTVYAAGSAADQNIGLSAKGANGNVLFTTNGAERIRISPTGQLGLGTTTPHAQLQLSSVSANRKIVMWETTNNDHQFYGFGVNGGALRYQTDATTSDHVFYAATSATTSNELMRIKGNGNVTVAGVVETEAFIAPTLLNGFTNYGAAFATAGYYKDKMGIVHLRGLITHTGDPDGLVMFTLPVGYRPATSGQLIFTVLSLDALGRIDVYTNGNVVITTGASGWVNLSDISFRAD